MIIHNMDCLEFLRKMGFTQVKCLFADIPDNINMKYLGYNDQRDRDAYYDWVRLLIMESLTHCQVFWLCYNAMHDIEISYIVRDILKYRHPSFEPNKFIWRYTFSQYNDHDCQYGYRPILRLLRRDAKMYPDAIREVSKRQELGDHRAAGPRVPDNVWSIPRIVGNSEERVTWMPTQLPIKLMERIISFSIGPHLLGDATPETLIDLFGGSGSALRAALSLFSRTSDAYNVECVEIDKETCEKMNALINAAKRP